MISKLYRSMINHYSGKRLKKASFVAKKILEALRNDKEKRLFMPRMCDIWEDSREGYALDKRVLIIVCKYVIKMGEK
jgi:hypothetical protein